MKLNRVTTLVNFLLIVALGSGCATQKLYDGPLLPLEEISVLIPDTYFDTLRRGDYMDTSVFNGNEEAARTQIIRVDNKVIYGKRILLLPGLHTLVFSYAVVIGREGNYVKSRQTTRSLKFNAEAGKTYYVFADVKWNADHTDAPYAQFLVKSLPYIEPW